MAGQDVILELKKFFIILNINIPKYTKNKISITISSTYDDWEHSGMNQELIGTKNFVVESFKDEKFIKHLESLIRKNPTHEIYIVGDKFMYLEDDKSRCLYGFKYHFNKELFSMGGMKIITDSMSKHYLKEGI